MPSGQGSVKLSGRTYTLLAIFVAVALIWIVRLVYLQVIVADDYSEQANATRTTTITIQAKRGTIYDRNGAILATSVDATSIYADPREVEDADAEAEQLAAVLGGTKEYYRTLLTEDTTFVYIKRQADVDVGLTVKDLGLAGIHFLDDTKRVYPYGQTGGQVVGFCNIDGTGLTGLELEYDDILKGTNGTRTEQVGADGTPIPNGVEEYTPVENGQDIIVSIDIDMQASLEQKLSDGIEQIGGSDGTAVLMDAGTGEIYAIASTPYFNPSDTSQVEDGATSIKAVSQAFEPGSSFKTISATAILESGEMTTDTEVNCPAYLYFDEGYTISDAHSRSDTTMTLRQIIATSSNVGISLSVDHTIGFSALYDKIVQYGMTSATGIDYPGESSGYLADPDNWSTVQAYNVTFGQGVSVTPLQLVRFYGALTNDGVACTPHLLIQSGAEGRYEKATYDSEQIIDNTDAIEPMVSMLESVVTEGTGQLAAIDGYAVAGKTGTAEYADESGGYVEDSWNVDFVGFLPNSSSQLVCYVGVDKVASGAPTTSIFQNIMSDAIQRYSITEN